MVAQCILVQNIGSDKEDICAPRHYLYIESYATYCDRRDQPT